MKLLDTTVVVDHLRGREEATRLLRHEFEAGTAIAASELVRFELLAGMRDGEVERLAAFFSSLRWVGVNDDIARTAAALFRRHRTAHAGIGVADYIIAASALVLDAELLTTNVRHFPMLAGLEPAY